MTRFSDSPHGHRFTCHWIHLPHAGLAFMLLGHNQSLILSINVMEAAAYQMRCLDSHSCHKATGLNGTGYACFLQERSLGWLTNQGDQPNSRHKAAHLLVIGSLHFSLDWCWACWVVTNHCRYWFAKCKQLAIEARSAEWCSGLHT